MELTIKFSTDTVKDKKKIKNSYGEGLGLPQVANRISIWQQDSLPRILCDSNALKDLAVHQPEKESQTEEFKELGKGFLQVHYENDNSGTTSQHLVLSHE